MWSAHALDVQHVSDKNLLESLFDCYRKLFTCYKLSKKKGRVKVLIAIISLLV